jgi:hypothetical protein
MAFSRSSSPIANTSMRCSAISGLVFVELPAEGANASLYDSIKRSGAIILTGLVLAVLSVLFLARRMVAPIQIPRNPDQGPSA